MYNEELKEQFIENEIKSETTKQVCRSVFKATEKYEEEWDRDLCTRSKEELQPMVNKIVGLRNSSKYSRLNVLYKYVGWCLKIGVEGAKDDMLEIKDIGLDSIREKMVANPTHLQEYLDAICFPESVGATDNIYRCYYWLAYAGVEEEDILDIKCSDVDFKRMNVKYPQKNKIVPLYRESLEAFHNCVEKTQFKYIHPGETDYDMLKDRVAGDTVVRGIRSMPTTMGMRNELSRRSKRKSDKTNLRLSYKRVWRSGVFYREYMKEMSGQEADFKPLIDQQMSGKSYSLSGSKNAFEVKRRQLIRDIEEDYSRWKLAYVYK